MEHKKIKNEKDQKKRRLPITVQEAIRISMKQFAKELEYLKDR